MKNIIAEIGSVHDGSFGNAKKLIELASNSGANIVKFQTHISEFETISNAPNPKYFQDENRYEYFNRTAFNEQQWNELIKFAKKLNIEFMSSPFSIEALQLLIKFGVKNIKIASGEVTNLPLIEYISKLKKINIYLSSGMSNWEELDLAVNILKDCNLTIMQCTSLYPCPPNEVGLNILEEMKNRYNNNIGFSDHTLGFAAPFAACALGVTSIEKHLTFSKEMYGSDAKNAMEPKDFKIMSSGIREIWQMLDSPKSKNNIKKFKNMKNIFQKSIVLKKALFKGNKLSLNNIAFKKPGNGIPPIKYKEVIGKKLKKDLPFNHILKFEDLN